MIYNSKVLSKRDVARDTIEFTLLRPDNFEYQSGQTIDLTLIDPSEIDSRGNIRTFSLVSAPHERDLKIAMRIRSSAFKRVLKTMDDNLEICIEGPFGSFVLHKNIERPAVFMAGGIGITPIFSIIKDATERKLEHKIILFYSNHGPEDSAFLSELQELKVKNPNFTLVATMTDAEKTDGSWNGERGYIDADMVKKYLPKDTKPIYYLVGPQVMVEAMKDLLNKMSIDSDDIRFEEFVGY